MFRDKFDPSSEEGILHYAGGLIGHTLAEVADIPASEINKKAKGRIGNLVEKYYFGYEPNSVSAPDFPEAGLELKVTGLKVAGKKGLVAKERLSLNMINYHELVAETFESSSFYAKCKKILVICYLYDNSKSELEQVFTEHQFIFRLENAELEDIKRDWTFIQAKVRDGKAHEISEGDTLFLKASRKGAGGDKDLTSQPFSVVSANRRGWSFNSGYLTALIEDGMANRAIHISAPTEALEDTISRLLGAYVGVPTDQLLEDFHVGTKSKSKRHDLVVKILSDAGKSFKDALAAGIRIKTVRLKHGGKAREAMSFARFDYIEVAQQGWDESDFCQALEDKFLLAVFEEDENGVERFKKVSLWNMPYEDRLMAKEVWEETQARILSGSYEFPQSSESAVAHVRPHARNAEDKALCPDGLYRLKRSFWLNQKYIERVVFEL